MTTLDKIYEEQTHSTIVNEGDGHKTRTNISYKLMLGI